MPCLFLLALLSAVGARPLAAQSTSSSLDDVRVRQVPVSERVKADAAGATFSLGPIRLLPRVEISQLGYDSNVFASDTPESDEVARGRAGLRGILPVGRKVYLIADALPGYDYYLHHSQLRRSSGRYGVDFLGLFNRLSLDVSGFTDRGRDLLSTELLEPVGRRTEGGRADVEIEFLRRLGLVLDYERTRIRYDEGGSLDPAIAGVSQLNRTESVGRGGVRYHFGDRVSLAALFEDSTTSFEQSPSLRNSRSFAPLLVLHYDQPRLYVDLSGGYRRVRPDSAGAFPEFSGATGSFFVSYAFPARWLGMQAYGHRGLDDSLYQNLSFFREDRIGAGPSFRIGARIDFWFFGETGRNVYLAPVTTSAGPVIREDRVRAVGGEVGFRISRRLAASLNAASTRYNSNIGGLDRRVFRVQTGISLNGGLAE